MSNEEAIKLIQGIEEDGRNVTSEHIEALDLAIKALKERPQGEWIIDGHHIRCNRCYEYICNTDREGNEIPDNFCPNCGAKMRGEEE